MRVWWVGFAVLIGFAVVAPATSSGHDVGTAAGHLAEDSVVHRPALERRLERRTTTATATDAKRAAAFGGGGRSPRCRYMGATRQLARRRRARRAPTQREGAGLRLGRRPRHRDLSGSRLHARHGMGSRDGGPDPRGSTPASTSSAAASRTSSTARFSSPAATRTRRSTGSPRRTCSATRRTRGRAARHGRRALVPEVTPLRNGEMLITEGGPAAGGAHHGGRPALARARRR